MYPSIEGTLFLHQTLTLPACLHRKNKTAGFCHKHKMPNYPLTHAYSYCYSAGRVWGIQRPPPSYLIGNAAAAARFATPPDALPPASVCVCV